VKPIQQTGFRSGTDFFLGFSPEREDPGNKHFDTITIPKVVAGDGPQAKVLIQSFYGSVMKQVAVVSSESAPEICTGR
jgi:UDP-N-acetyl-D-glucosamine dehydrogenase